MTLHRVVFCLRPEDSVGPRVERHAEPPEHLSPPLAGGDDHLAWGFVAGADEATAWYLFDESYARAHPESLDPAHLGLLHALLEFKLFDDGALIAPRPMISGALRWPRTAEPRRPLARE